MICENFDVQRVVSKSKFCEGSKFFNNEQIYLNKLFKKRK